jgi:hypothetical protein
VCAGFNLKNPHPWGFFYGLPYCSARQAKRAAPNAIKESETAPFFIKQSTAPPEHKISHFAPCPLKHSRIFKFFKVWASLCTAFLNARETKNLYQN